MDKRFGKPKILIKLPVEKEWNDKPYFLLRAAFNSLIMDKVVDFRRLAIEPRYHGMGCAPVVGDVEYIEKPSYFGYGLANGEGYNYQISVEKCFGCGNPLMLADYEYDDKPF